jgi:hypothetical protein
MKTLLVILAIAATPLVSQAHEYFFSFAEMEYNDISQRVEMTLIVTTHDFERALEKKGQKIENIRSLSVTEKEAIESYVNRHFNVSSGEEKSTLSFVGNEISMDGTSNWYFESEPIAFLETIKVYYDMLMEVFPTQQNKLTLYYKGESYTAAFTSMHKTKQLYFENKEQ